MSVNWKKILEFSSAILGFAFVITGVVAQKKKGQSVYENEPGEKNPYEGKKVVFVKNKDDPINADGVRGHLEAIGDSNYKSGFYEKYVKRGMDIVLSFGGLVILSPILLSISIVIMIDDPGPVLFTQKRVGKNKKYFKLHKFRSMKMSTPHDCPTHMLGNPDQYITRIGKFLRAHSLDELPQIWDIFIGNMSVIGPRPGLWNQDLLIAERDKYGANDMKPGLTGWAQINGRDELDILEKAKLDGEYCKNLGLKMDIVVFLKSLGVFSGDTSIVEGSTGEITNCSDNQDDINNTLHEVIPTRKKKILVTGKNSYIGESFKSYLETLSDFYEIDNIDTRSMKPDSTIFKGYDVIFHVAGIAHVKETEENKHLYYEVNRDLTIKIAKSAKEAGVKQFILLSSMSVYGLTTGHITKNSIPNPINAYGKSKLQADIAVKAMADNDFLVALLRPPMVYGKGCKGNYQQLRKFVIKSPFFPKYENKRSMIFIGNLCEFVKRVIDNNAHGLFFPQNEEYICTSDMVKYIAKENEKKILELSIFNIPIKFAPLNKIKKVFGDLTYEHVDYVNKFCFEDSIKLTEEDEMINFCIPNKGREDIQGKRILFFAPVFFGYEHKMTEKMQELGAIVDFYDERSVTSSRDRALLKISPELFAKRSYRYYKKIIIDNKTKNYDYIFIVKGEMTPIEILKEFRIVFPNAKLCLYLYDSVVNIPGIEKKFQYFDSCHSFDPVDCKSYSELKFKPLFYADQFRKPLKKASDYAYDICFLGTIHSDRYEIIKNVKRIAELNGLRQKWFLYLQSHFIYYFYKVTKKEFRDTRIDDFDYSKKSSEQIANIVDQTNIVLDIQHPKQIGLTIRTIEMMGMNKKLITTNKTIKKYDFYNPNNICVIDRDSTEINMEFFNTPYQEIDKNIYDDYSLENWIKTVLS